MILVTGSFDLFLLTLSVMGMLPWQRPAVIADGGFRPHPQTHGKCSKRLRWFSFQGDAASPLAVSWPAASSSGSDQPKPFVFWSRRREIKSMSSTSGTFRQLYLKQLEPTLKELLLYQNQSCSKRVGAAFRFLTLICGLRAFLQLLLDMQTSQNRRFNTFTAYLFILSGLYGSFLSASEK